MMVKRKWALIIPLMILLTSFCVITPEWRVQAASSSGDDWPMFHHDAAHTGYSRSSVPTTPVIVWSYPTDGPIADSPVIAEGIVYFSSWSFYGDYRVYALNASTGTLIWNRPNVSPSTPAVAEGYVYTNGYAYNASTGELLLNYTDYQGYTSPTVTEGMIYLGYVGGVPPPYVGGVFALNAATGAKVWNFTAGSVYSAPTVANGIVYFCDFNYNVYALNASTGVQIWNVTTIGNTFSSPAVANGYVYVNGYSSLVYCLDAYTGAEIWRHPASSGPEVSPAVGNGNFT